MAMAPASSEENKADGDEESDDWEDIDCDDGEIEAVEEVNSDEEEGSSEPSNNSNMMQQEDSKSDFVIIDGASGSGQQPSSSSFSLLDSRTGQSKSGITSAEKTESF